MRRFVWKLWNGGYFFSADLPLVTINTDPNVSWIVNTNSSTTNSTENAHAKPQKNLDVPYLNSNGQERQISSGGSSNTLTINVTPPTKSIGFGEVAEWELTGSRGSGYGEPASSTPVGSGETRILPHRSSREFGHNLVRNLLLGNFADELQNAAPSRVSATLSQSMLGASEQMRLDIDGDNQEARGAELREEKEGQLEDEDHG